MSHEPGVDPYQRAMLLQDVGRHAEADVVLSGWLAKSPDDARALRQLAGLRADAGDYEGAKTAIDRAIATDPSNVHTHVLLSLITLRMGEVSRAREAAATAVKLEPQNSRAHMMLAQALSASPSLHDSAVNHARESVRLAPQSANAYEVLGLVLANRAQSEDRPIKGLLRWPRDPDRTEARGAYREALRLEPGNWSVQANLAVLDIQDRRLSLGFSSLGSTLAINPHHGTSAFNTDVLLIRLGRRALRTSALLVATSLILNVTGLVWCFVMTAIVLLAAVLIFAPLIRGSALMRRYARQRIFAIRELAGAFAISGLIAACGAAAPVMSPRNPPAWMFLAAVALNVGFVLLRRAYARAQSDKSAARRSQPARSWLRPPASS